MDAIPAVNYMKDRAADINGKEVTKNYITFDRYFLTVLNKP